MPVFFKFHLLIYSLNSCTFLLFFLAGACIVASNPTSVCLSTSCMIEIVFTFLTLISHVLISFLVFKSWKHEIIYILLSSTFPLKHFLHMDLRNTSRFFLLFIFLFSNNFSFIKHNFYCSNGNRKQQQCKRFLHFLFFLLKLAFTSSTHLFPYTNIFLKTSCTSNFNFRSLFVHIWIFFSRSNLR